jgi:type IV pilus assembly protein PilC
MLTYEYSAKDANGNTVNATVQASSEAAAAKLIMEQGLSPLDIKSIDDSDSFFSRFTDRITSKDKVLFARQLSTLINAGLPLTQSLRTVLEQINSKKFSTIVSQVITDVEGGNAFADALAKQPDVFNNVFVSMVAAGETSGTLDEALERIATQQEKDAEITSKVKGALVYPAIVVFVIIGVVIFMLTTVLPQVELLYNDLNQELPFVTRILLLLSNFITSFWWLAIGLFVGSIYFLRRYIDTEPGRDQWDHLKMRVPLFGKLFMKVYMTRFTRIGATLMKTGVPMLEMMKVTSKAVNNVHVEGALVKASEKVKGGTALSQSISGDPNFLPLVPQMIKIGEQSGAIDQMMDKVATFYENEVDNEVKTISTTIEPILMVVLAVVAGIMVAAILLPVYGLVGQTIT